MIIQFSYFGIEFVSSASNNRFLCSYSSTELLKTLIFKSFLFNQVWRSLSITLIRHSYDHLNLFK